MLTFRSGFDELRHKLQREELGLGLAQRYCLARQRSTVAFFPTMIVHYSLQNTPMFKMKQNAVKFSHQYYFKEKGISIEVVYKLSINLINISKSVIS